MGDHTFVFKRTLEYLHTLICMCMFAYLCMLVWHVFDA